MAEVKGVLLNGWMRFLKGRYGIDAVGEAIETLTPDDRRTLSATFLPSSWYAYDALHSLRRLTRAVAKPGEKNLAVEIGRAMAHNAFTGVYHPLLMKDVARQVEQFPTIADFFFKETRRLEAKMLAGTSAEVRYIYEKGAKPTRGICASIAGFWCQTLELAGAKLVKFEHPQCVTDGGPYCEFLFRWS